MILKQKKEDKLFFVLSVLCLAIVCHYSKNSWGWPSLDAYPLIERFLDPSFLTNDPFTNQSADFFSARHAIAWMIAGIVKVTSARYDLVVAVVNLAVLFGLGLAVGFFTYQFTRSLRAASFAILIWAAFKGGTPFQVAGWDLTYRTLTAQQVAQLFLIPAIVLPNRLWAFVLIAVGTSFHPTMGVEVGAITMLVMVMQSSITRRDIIGVVIFIVVFLGNVYFYRQAMNGVEALSFDRFYHIYVRSRHPHHFLPPPVMSYLIVIAGLGFLLFWSRNRPKEQRNLLRVWVGAMLFALMIGSLISILRSKYVVTLMPFRLVSYLNLFLILAIADKVAKVTPTLKFNYPKAIPVGVLGLTFVVVSFSTARIKTPVDYWRNENSPYFLTLKWLNEHTEKDSIVVAPYEMTIDTRLLARRAVYVDGCFPHLERHYEAWYERHSFIYGPVLSDRNYYDQHINETLARLKQGHQAHYVVVASSARVDASPVYRNESYSIYDLRSQVDIFPLDHNRGN